MKNKKLSVGSFCYNSPVQAKDISEMTGLSSSDISNRKRRNLNFPIDRNEKKGTPIYYYGDVLKWAHDHNIPIYGKKTRYRDIQRLQRESMDSALNVSLIGRARGGKSFIASYFIEFSVFMRQALCGGGSDFTQIPTKIVINDTASFFRCDVGKELTDKITPEIEPYIRRAVSIDVNAPDFQLAMNVINSWLRDLHNSGIGPLDKLVSLELYTRPSKMAKNIMERTGKRSIILTDTPGISGDYSFESLGRQDIVVIVMRDENMQEFVQSIEKIAGLVGTTSVVYVYRTNDNVTENDEYYEAQQAGFTSVERFEKQIESAFNKESIIMSSINALHPLDHFVALPIFKAKKYSAVEDLFTNDFAEQIITGFENKISAESVGAALKEAHVNKDDVLVLLNSIILFPEMYPIDLASRNSAVDKFKKERHARVKSQDQYRIINDVDRLSEETLLKNKEKMAEYSLKDYPEQWKQKLVQFVFQTIDRTIKSYPGVGIGLHPWEDSPAVTMRSCESIFAAELYAALKDFEDKVEYSDDERMEVTRKYREVLQSYNIQSNSWDRAIANPYSISELRTLAESGLLNGKCEEKKYIQDLIRHCAINGLLYRAAIDIYTDILWEIEAYEGEKQVTDIVKAHLPMVDG